MFGVMNDKMLITREGLTIIQENLWIHWWTIERLFEMCRERNLKQLWILNGSGFWNDIKSESEVFEACKQVDFLTDAEKENLTARFLDGGEWNFAPKKFENLITGWKNGFRCQIIFCGLVRDNWSFDTETDAATLFNAIELFIEKIKIMPSFPIRTSQKLLESTIARKLGAVADDAADYFKPFTKNDSNLIWLRDLEIGEIGKKYIHAFDKRSMYLSACSSLQLGESEYEIIENEIYSKNSDFVGLCDVEFTWKKSVNKPFFAKLFETKGLFYTAHLDLFIEHASEIKINRGWIWRKKNTRKTFEKFYKIVSTAKKETSNCEGLSCKVANSAIKNLYTDFFGWMRKRENAESEWNKKYFRPDWRGMIISQANANLLRNCLEIQNNFVSKPFAILHDCLMFVSDEKDYRNHFAGSCLTDENRFSHEWTIEADAVFYETGKAKLKLMEIDKLGKAQNG